MDDNVNLVAALQRLRDQYKSEATESSTKTSKRQKEIVSRMRVLLKSINKSELQEELSKRVKAIEEFLGEED